QPEALEQAHRWLDEMDARVQAAPLRSLLQTTQLATEENLHDLIVRYLAREPKDDSLRDRLDFLLVQFFSHCASPVLHQGEVALEDVAQVMEPVLGECSTDLPAWLQPLEEALQALHRCGSLRELLDQGVLQRGRQVKVSAGPMFFGSAPLLAFVRFNFLVRRAFFRLLQGDLHAIRHGLDELERRGIETLDCTRAQLAAQEPASHLRQICRDWREAFRAPYRAGESFRQLAEIRAAVEAALAAVVPEAGPAPADRLQPSAASEESPAPPIVAPQKAAAPPPPQEEPQAQVPAEAPKPAPAAKLEPSPQPSPRPLVLEIEEAQDRIAEQLLKNGDKKSISVTSIEIGGAKLLLSSWEVAAFVEGGDQLSDALQRAVAARAILVEVIAACRKQPAGRASAGSDEAAALEKVIAAAKAEGATMQTAVEDARNAKNIDAAVNLAATAKRLQASADEARKFLP
ncbi:MAG TPA: hypothetical protein VEG08_02815, partial [Terriglobales bacterium]|nr:hypothetical protein [Terriglobales bacterium]